MHLLLNMMVLHTLDGLPEPGLLGRGTSATALRASAQPLLASSHRLSWLCLAMAVLIRILSRMRVWGRGWPVTGEVEWRASQASRAALS